MKLVDLTRIEQFGLFLRIPESSTQYALGHVLRKSIWPDVDKFGGEVRIYRCRFRVQVESDLSGHFGVLRERLGRVKKHIVASFDGTLVARSRSEVACIAAEWTTGRGHRFGRVVGKVIRGFAG